MDAPLMRERAASVGTSAFIISIAVMSYSVHCLSLCSLWYVIVVLGWCSV
jgi:hypothetical protein